MNKEKIIAFLIGIAVFGTIGFIMLFYTPKEMEEGGIRSKEEVTAENIIDETKTQETEEEEKEIQKKEEEERKKQEAKWGKVREKIQKYKEVSMTLDTYQYYDYGLWDTALDFDDRLFCSEWKDSITKQNMLITWEEKEQKDEEFPPKAFLSGKKYKARILAPYRRGEDRGYLVQIWKKKKTNLYFMEKSGKLIQELPLQKIFKEKIDKYKMPYRVTQTGDTIVVIVENRRKEVYYIFEIDPEKGTLVSKEKYPYWIIGADNQYCYGVRIKKKSSIQHYVGGGADFVNGKLVIIDRKTKKQISLVKIPNDVTNASLYYNRTQCFDIRNQTVWLANRTGIYFLKPKDSKWTKIMNAKQSSYLNTRYTLSDITVVDKNTFYLMALFGDDAESAEFLIKYQRKKGH